MYLFISMERCPIPGSSQYMYIDTDKSSNIIYKTTSYEYMHNSFMQSDESEARRR